MQESTKLIYSAFSGTFFTIPEKDVMLMEIGQLPLTKQPSSGCKKCFGRGHLGRDKENLAYELCNCVRKVIDVETVNKIFQEKMKVNTASLQ